MTIQETVYDILTNYPNAQYDAKVFLMFCKHNWSEWDNEERRITNCLVDKHLNKLWSIIENDNYNQRRNFVKKISSQYYFEAQSVFKVINNFKVAFSKYQNDNDYNDDASQIWADNPPSGLVVSRFLQFNGVGIKVATMATNILVRQYNIKMQDRHCIDISPDTHTVRVFQRLGLISKDEHISNKKEKDHKAKTEAMYMARMINPEYPGILDYPCWDVGKNYCKARNPICYGEKDKGPCPFSHFCPSKMKTN